MEQEVDDRNDAVGYSTDGDVAVVTIANPPVNALGYAVRSGIVAALERAAADPAVKAVVLTGAGRTFSGGADITEFGKPPREPGLSAVIRHCESLAKPVVAAIRGVALGGGLELALACHARVAAPDARLGLPEVKLGLLPGAGGTQRLPRVVGPEAAVEMIVTGTPIAAAKAATLGLVDGIVEDDLVAGATAHARALVESRQTPVPVRDREDRLAATRRDPSAFEAKAKQLTQRTRGLEAPLACVRAVRMALDTPFDEALSRERALFTELLDGFQSKAQRHLFFAEREATKVAGVGREVTPRPVARVGVVGAGTMGGGIAMTFANAGIPVTLVEMNREALERGLGVIRKNYDLSVARGSLGEQERDRRLALITGSTRYEDLAVADLVIEAVFEEMAVKKEVFGRLDRIARPGAILASNTSYLDIDAIADATGRPADVVGTHFFSPANVMKLLEIVRGRRTAPDVLATLLGLAKRIGKVPVVVGVCHGFVGNRMLAARSAENEALLLEGALPQEVDRAFTDFGFPMGPFAMGDLAGLDVGWRNRKSLGRTAVIADALCEAGRFGQKTGEGFYRYEAGSRRPEPDPWVEALIAGKARERGIERRPIAAEEIVERTLYPMINEGARILEEGIAARPSDIDVAWVDGYGFPVGKGGPMFWADHVGLATIVERLDDWHGKTGRELFAAAPLLRRLAADGGSFAALGRKAGAGA
ncbi:short chain enoyl-CoA hydratase /3-hydroxyacyl-CoA dehydrogenase [Tistlia consotensis]|uniref:Short chain enoyl-CoA hydratase /3-hydroxyacyl-CoA dehydrogenase n=1 Tax=Tistlia consotensis USBA 355 TaxID=560819 RepID=A0A1Y6BCJ5_9PROT|nr:3-hydroxyacyl-CoA dehydrogenase NAD-binding domain-containing protein [Tistlia consotensis]SMF04230.1 short chain enoyl-CoA hydratase /3-hydroxyacyl-CoA dehydrogenase [Tistlia consotensis USBA 355]SNR54345.1 short chain enoyl-CoA hydratase /3-hydroxyacyl-CoA dehydrogenase [Tistlia consotensis]